VTDPIGKTFRHYEILDRIGAFRLADRRPHRLLRASDAVVRGVVFAGPDDPIAERTVAVLTGRRASADRASRR